MEGQAGTFVLGRAIFLVGIISQGLSYVIYDCLVVTSHHSVRREALRKGDPKHEPWWRVFNLIYFSSVFIIVRDIIFPIYFTYGSASLTFFLVFVTDSVYISHHRDSAR